MAKRGGICVIVTAAGEGRRMKSRVPKPLLPLLGKPILIRTLEAFRGIPGIDEIILTLPPHHVKGILGRLGKQFYRLGVKKIVSGGKTRRDSVANGLRMADHSARIVAVHDAARPLVSKSEIEAVLRAAERNGAAIVALPARDTMKEVGRKGAILRTPDRSLMWHALTPQAFRAKLLREAYGRIRGKVTDDSQLVERLGRRVVVVEGSPRNIKITTPADLKVAETLLKAGRK